MIGLGFLVGVGEPHQLVALDASSAIGVRQWSRSQHCGRTVLRQAANRAAVLCRGWVEKQERGPATIDHVQPVGFPRTFQQRPFVMFATAVGSPIDAGGNEAIDFEICVSSPLRQVRRWSVLFLVCSFRSMAWPNSGSIERSVPWLQPPRSRLRAAHHPASLSLLQRVPLLSTFPVAAMRLCVHHDRLLSVFRPRPVTTGTRASEDRARICAGRARASRAERYWVRPVGLPYRQAFPGADRFSCCENQLDWVSE
jgi:hypothetical protein